MCDYHVYLLKSYTIFMLCSSLGAAAPTTGLTLGMVLFIGYISNLDLSGYLID